MSTGDYSGGSSQLPMLAVATSCGIIGSLLDSIIGGTLQATYYSKDRKCIVKGNDVKKFMVDDDSIIRISGSDIISNEAVNFHSTLLTMILSIWIAPKLFCLFDTQFC